MAEVEIACRPPGYVLVRVDGEVDLNTRLPLVEAVDRAVLDGDGPVVLDLCGVCFFSLAGVDWVEASIGALTARGRTVRVVCAAPGPVWRLVRLLALDQRWPVRHSVTDAVADLQALVGDALMTAAGYPTA